MLKRDYIHIQERLFVKFVYFFLMLFLYGIVITTEGIYNSDAVYISNALIVVYSLYHLLANETTSYSAKKVFYLFVFFFMGIAPVLQYKNGDQTVGGYDIHEGTYVLTNYIILGILICFDIFYYLFYTHKTFGFIRRNFFRDVFLPIEDNKRIRILMFLISLFSLCFTIYHFKDSLYLLVFRGLDGVEIDTSSNSGNFGEAFFSTFLRPLSVVCCVNYWCIGRRKYLKFLLLVIMLLACFPTSLARLRVAAYYLPLLIIMFPSLRWKNRYVLLLAFGLLFVFPFLDIFRSWGEENITFNPDFEMFRTMHFDSYQSFAFVIQNNIITWGRQLLLVLFFWIPRSIWETKPYMSGIMVADDYGLWFSQISMNYFGEGYLNAGIIGVFIFVVILAYITAFFDKLYWLYNGANIKSLFTPFYLFFIGMYFFFMRGDLMYGTQYTVMLLFANYVVFRIIKKAC